MDTQAQVPESEEEARSRRGHDLVQVIDHFSSDQSISMAIDIQATEFNNHLDNLVNEGVQHPPSAMLDTQDELLLARERVTIAEGAWSAFSAAAQLSARANGTEMEYLERLLEACLVIMTAFLGVMSALERSFRSYDGTLGEAVTRNGRFQILLARLQIGRPALTPRPWLVEHFMEAAGIDPLFGTEVGAAPVIATPADKPSTADPTAETNCAICKEPLAGPPDSITHSPTNAEYVVVPCLTCNYLLHSTCAVSWMETTGYESAECGACRTKIDLQRVIELINLETEWCKQSFLNLATSIRNLSEFA